MLPLYVPAKKSLLTGSSSLLHPVNTNNAKTVTANNFNKLLMFNIFLLFLDNHIFNYNTTNC